MKIITQCFGLSSNSVRTSAALKTSKLRVTRIEARISIAAGHSQALTRPSVRQTIDLGQGAIKIFLTVLQFL